MRTGITLVAVFMLTMFALSAYSSITMYIAKKEFVTAFKEEAKAYGVKDVDVEMLIPYVAGIGLLFSILYLFTGIGLLMRNEAFRKVGVGIGGLHLVYGFLTVYIPMIAGLNLAIGSVVIYYLTRKEVKEEFVKSISIEERILGEEWRGKIN